MELQGLLRSPFFKSVPMGMHDSVDLSHVGFHQGLLLRQNVYVPIILG